MLVEGISDIKISGMDPARPPRIRKEPYIDLYFKISHKAPASWCDGFNRIASERQLKAKIDPSDGLFIVTWVRKPEDIEPVLTSLKAVVSSSNEDYIARIEAERRAAAARSSDPENEGEQGRLNRIIAGLKFDA